jgi:hypothetical protein
MINGTRFTQTGTMTSDRLAGQMLKTGEEKMRAFLAERFPEIYGTPVEAKTSTITNIRKAVASLANKINGKIKNLSAAFKKAWAIIKGKVVTSRIAGVTFGNSQTVLQRLTRYNLQDINVELVRVNNEHDVNAVGVDVSVRGSQGYRIGFLPRNLAQYISKLIDNGIALITTFKGVTGGAEYYHNYGALIEIKAKGNI